jgi:hypothetical protein
MANQETQKLDTIIASRRAMLLGGSALAALALTPSAKAALAPTSYTDADILNFALNLEYLEANFYYLAAFGTTIDKSNSASTAAGAAIQGITGTGTQGTVTVKANAQVPFADARVKSYAIETAIEEGKHVNFLRTALGSAAVAQPAINLQASFNGLATAAAIGATFDPFASDAFFLVGAYIFEDVGVSAYSGAAPLISTSAQGKSYLQAAAGILAVEAYHAGLVRTTINTLDPTNSLGYLGYTQKISTLRATLAKAVAPSTANPLDTNPDDIPLTVGTTQVSLAGTSATSLTIADADATNVIAFARTTTQVLNIVTAGGSAASGTKATGGFFPSGLNGTFA